MKEFKVVVTAFITKNGRLLIARRNASKKLFPEHYELPGGKVEWGEELEEALKREIREELDAKINVFEPFHCFTYHFDGIHYVEIVYFAELASPDVKLNEHTDLRWVTKAEVNSYKISEHIKEAIVKGFDFLME